MSAVQVCKSTLTKPTMNKLTDLLGVWRRWKSLTQHFQTFLFHTLRTRSLKKEDRILTFGCFLNCPLVRVTGISSKNSAVPKVLHLISAKLIARLLHNSPTVLEIDRTVMFRLLQPVPRGSSRRTKTANIRFSSRMSWFFRSYSLSHSPCLSVSISAPIRKQVVCSESTLITVSMHVLYCRYAVVQRRRFSDLFLTNWTTFRNFNWITAKLNSNWDYFIVHSKALSRPPDLLLIYHRRPVL